MAELMNGPNYKSECMPISNSTSCFAHSLHTKPTMLNTKEKKKHHAETGLAQQ